MGGPVRLLLLGLDGADPRVVDALAAAGRLPALGALGLRGLRRPIRSTVPAATLPAWTTCLTGAGPGRHGVFDFTTRDGYGVRFGPPRPAVPTWLETLGDAGLRVGAIGFPGRLHGDALSAFHVAGWDTPLETSAGRRHVRPPALHDRLLAALDRRALAFAAVDECAADARPHAFVDGLRQSVRSRTEVALFLAAERPVDVLAVHFAAADTAGHHLWPRPGEEGSAPAAGVPEGIARVYEALDEAVDALSEALRPAAVVAVSDHGMGPTADLVVSVNTLLERAGFLRRRRTAATGRLAGLLRRAGLYALPAGLRARVVDAAGAALADAVESAARSAWIDFDRTAAWSDELTYAPAVRLNVRGREPRGTIAPADRERAAGEAAACLRAARRPDGGPLFSSVRLREEVYEGPFVERAPDVVLEIAEDGTGRTPVLCPPHRRAALGDGWHMLVPEAERAGRKGGVLRGSHRPLGVLAAAPAPAWLRDGPEPDLVDVARLVHDLLGAAPAPTRRRTAAGTDGLTAAERRTLARRLRRLGYVE